jgi:hypothetical protein
MNSLSTSILLPFGLENFSGVLQRSCRGWGVPGAGWTSSNCSFNFAIAVSKDGTLLVYAQILLWLSFTSDYRFLLKQSEEKMDTFVKKRRLIEFAFFKKLHAKR